MTDTLGFVSVAAITIICYLAGMACKLNVRIKDEAIPVIVGFAGVLLGIVAYLTKMPEFAGMHILEAIGTGIYSGAAATWVNQLFKQAQKGD